MCVVGQRTQNLESRCRSKPLRGCVPSTRSWGLVQVVGLRGCPPGGAIYIQDQIQSTVPSAPVERRRATTQSPQAAFRGKSLADQQAELTPGSTGYAIQMAQLAPGSTGYAIQMLGLAPVEAAGPVQLKPEPGALQAKAASPHNAQSHPMLSLGDEGGQVRELQLKLNAAGASDEGLTINCEFDWPTRTAVVRFQQEYGLAADGIVGPNTWGRLDDVAGSRVAGQEEFEGEINDLKAAADDLRKAGQYGAALPQYEALYQRPNLPPEMRGGVLFWVGGCCQGLGRFGEAIDYYQEFMDLPLKGDTFQKPDALERIRECRAGKPPGLLVSKGGGPKEGEGMDPARHLAVKQEAEAKCVAGDFAGARPLLLQLYHNPSTRPEDRVNITFTLGTCEHDAGNFGAAISFYREHLEMVAENQKPEALERIRQCRAGKPPGRPGEVPSGKHGDIEALKAKVSAASALLSAGQYAAAYPLVKEIYHTPSISPGQRGHITFAVGRCEHEFGNFAEAVSYYGEFLQLPGASDHIDQRDALQRIREARAGKPPGKLESTHNSEKKAAV